MTAYTENEFDEALAPLANLRLYKIGIPVYESTIDGGVMYEFNEWNPYNDMNQLMPLAYEYGAIEYWINIIGEDKMEFDEFLSCIRTYMMNVANSTAKRSTS